MLIEWAVSITRCYVLTLNVDFKVKGTLQGGISSSLIAILSHRGRFHRISIHITIIRPTSWLKSQPKANFLNLVGTFHPMVAVRQQFLYSSFFITAYKCSGSYTIYGMVSLNVEDEKKISSYLNSCMFGACLQVVFIATKTFYPGKERALGNITQPINELLNLQMAV